MRKRREISPRAKRWGWSKFIMFVLILIISGLVGGFYAFGNAIKSMAPPSVIPNADGIVVLTGKGGGRLEAGAKLLKGGHGERLLISGVNPATPNEDVYALLDLSEELTTCCVDLDYAAEDTIENAKETAMWTQSLGYEHIILVTSAYHMPRALNEITAVTGRAKITAYPVPSDLADRWYLDGKSLNRLLREYGKFLVTLIRRSSDKDDRGAPILDPVPEAAKNNQLEEVDN